MGLLRLLGRLINLLADRSSRAGLRDLNRLEALYSRWDDAQLRTEVARRIQAAPIAREQAAGRSRLARFKDYPTLHMLAIAVCMFDRYPCDLPTGSAVYDEQRMAALALISGANVQMDTGEGKTYAIALAAAALLTEFPQVIVITANEYLARRDATRVRRFFDAAGIPCAYGLPRSDFHGVSYTNIAGLCFGYLERSYRRPSDTRPSDYPARAAVIIDEIDSVLLDQHLVHTLTRPLPSDENLWEKVFQFADGLTDRQYTYDPVADDFSLTADSWDEVSRLGHELRQPASLLMRLTTAALWARRSEEGRHYALDDDEVYLINQVTGERYTTSDLASAALQYLHNGHTPPVALTVAEIDGMTLLKRHPRVVGLSGTVAADTIYYMQQLRTLTCAVPPRFERHKAKVGIVVSTSREATFRYIVKRIREVQPRPVVIGTWSPAAARSVAAMLRAEGVIDDARLGVITAFGSRTDAAVLDVAGEPSRVTVLSQGGSRGVDIRSAHRPLLMVLGLAVEPRLDRQFLGRVGRHGEPYDAEFIVDQHSPVRVPTAHLTKLIGDTMPANRAVARVLTAEQRAQWMYRVQRRHQASVLSRAMGMAEGAAAARVARLRTAAGTTGMREYVAQLYRSRGMGADDAHSPETSQAMAVQASTVAALDRRQASDQLVTSFEAAMTAASGTEPGSYWLRRGVYGDPTEIVALTRWLNSGAARFGADADGSEGALFRRQAELAGAQRLAVRSSAKARTPADTAYETMVLANAALLERTHQRLASLAVTAAKGTYYRRGAFTVRNLADLSELSVPREVLANLGMVDHPELLDELFYSTEHMVVSHIPVQSDEPERQGTGELASGSNEPTPLAEGALDDVIARFLTEREAQSGGLAIPPESARLILLDVLRPLRGSLGTDSSAVLGLRVSALLDSLAATGIRGGKLRDHRRLIYDFTDALYEQGLLPQRLPRESGLVSAARRMRTFADTIQPVGVAAAVGYLAVLAAGTLLNLQPARHLGLLDAATQLLGFGVSLPGRPFLVLFAGLLTLQAAVRACGVPDPSVMMTRLSGPLAIALAFAGYYHGVASLGWTLLLAAGLIVWSAMLLATHRLVIAFIGTDPSAVVGAASVLTFLISAAAHGRVQAYLLIVFGVAAALAGPTIPVAIDVRQYVRGNYRHADERARIKILIDPALASALLASLAVDAAARLHGTVAVTGFALVQTAALAFIAIRRLSVPRIKGLLARRQVGTPLSDEQLRRHLRRAVIGFVALAALTLAGCVATGDFYGEASAALFLIEEWAGVILISGIFSLGSALSVAGVAAVLRPLEDEQTSISDRIRAVREDLRTWRRMRFAWIWKTGLSIAAVYGVLTWVSDLLGVKDMLLTLASWLIHRL